MKTLTYLFFVMLLCAPTKVIYAFSELETSSDPNAIQRVRIDVTTPNGYTRHLLLGFTPDNTASDGFDYGYDAQNMDDYANDCNWMIDHNRYVIQGVGAFHESKTYPLGVFLADAGNVEISLLALENFNQPISVYIYDTQTNQATAISDANYVQNLSSGDFINRFFVTFTDDVSLMQFSDNQLSVTDTNYETLNIAYLNSQQELQISASDYFEIQEIKVYTVLGQNVKSFTNLKSDTFGKLDVPLHNLSEGTYVVIIRTRHQKLSKRLIVTH
ncbi:MAG: T9SS type A sorting domain-containing protein [Algicola sp.]|nr:T9SS type A sorting domain-containing protein [Algicola sp.]